MSESFEVTDANRVRQTRERARYDHATVFDILSRGLVAHVGFIDDGRPVVIPMTYGFDDDRLYLHGARKSRIATTTDGEPVSISVTLVDGLVVARSTFDSSMNYRAVVIHGRAAEVTDDDERLRAMRCISDHMLPGRWDEVRAPYPKELKATVILGVTIEAASAKIRSGGVKEDDIHDDRVWAGVVPIAMTVGTPIPEPAVPAGVPLPPSVSRIRIN